MTLRCEICDSDVDIKFVYNHRFKRDEAMCRQCRDCVKDAANDDIDDILGGWYD